MTSEYSYLHSLSILVRNFKSSEALKKTMTATEHHHLFSNISVIYTVSKRYNLSIIAIIIYAVEFTKLVKQYILW